jgi:hypothetical protein
MRTCVYVFVFLLCFVCFSIIPYSWMSNSLFLLDTGGFICPTTRCRPCHRTFLPGLHRFSECACFAWLSTEILCLSASADFLTFLAMYLSVFSVLLMCECVFLCHGVHRQSNRHSREISEIVPACAHMQRSLAHPCAAMVTSVTLIRSRSSYTYTYTDTQACMFVCLLFEYT